MDRIKLEQLLKKTDELLWNAYSVSLDKKYELRKSNLVFPVYQNKSSNELRISEQEARFLFAEALRSDKFLFSIETPTINDYQQKGKGKRSAASDMSLYNSISGDKILNIEFKSEGISTKAKTSFTIEKDIEKILLEPTPGCWFHLLKSVDNSTIIELIKVLERDIICIKDKFNQSINNNLLTIHICVLEQGFSITIQLDVNTFNKDIFNDIDYCITRKELKTFNSKSWVLHKNNE